MAAGQHRYIRVLKQGLPDEDPVKKPLYHHSELPWAQGGSTNMKWDDKGKIEGWEDKPLGISKPDSPDGELTPELINQILADKEGEKAVAQRELEESIGPGEQLCSSPSGGKCERQMGGEDYCVNCGKDMPPEEEDDPMEPWMEDRMERVGVKGGRSDDPYDIKNSCTPEVFNNAWAVLKENNWGRRMPRTEEETYGDVSYRDHPLFGQEGYEAPPSTPDPAMAVGQGMIAARQRQPGPQPRPLDLSTPPNPFTNPQMIERLKELIGSE